MGKLVALNTNNEEKKLKTEQPTATIVAQGQRGKLMQTGSASAPVSSPPTVYRTSPVKTTPVTQQNVVTPKRQSKLGKATFSGNRTPGKQQKYSVGKGIAGATMKGINQAAQGIADTLALAEDVALSPFELVSGQQLGDLSDSGLANKLQRRIRNEGQEIEDKYAANVERGGKAAEAFDKYGALTVAAVPQAVAAVLTSGASLGATPATLAKTAATEMTPSIANTIRNSVFAMGKDPQYWLSFSQVVGSSYEQALDDMEKAGVDNNTARTKAALYATGNGLMNAAVEVGGGIQTLPEQLKHGSAAWKAWLESAFDEGKEEVVQGILERATQNVAYKKGNPLASMRDENAILNPRTSAKEFLGGAVVGGVLGGGQVGANAALQSLARFDNSLGESGRKALRGTYQEGKDTAEHVKDFIPAYNAGVEGKANPNPTNETAYAGYVAGQNDAKKAAGTGEHIDSRTKENVSDRNVNAFQFDHPELHSYYSAAAEQIAGIADMSLSRGQQKGARQRTANGYQRSNQIFETPAMRKAMDEGLTRTQIIDAAQRIINDNGQENVKAAKTLEIVLDDMLTNGYTAVDGTAVAPNTDYIAAKQQITGAEAQATGFDNYVTDNRLALETGEVTMDELRAEYAQQEGAEHGEAVHLREGSERDNGANPRGEVRGVEEGTGRNPGRKEGRHFADSEAASLDYGEKVSTASFGIGRGAFNDSVYLVKNETAEMRKAKDLAKERGLRVTFFAGNNLTFRDKSGKAFQVRGYVSGDRVFIRADHPEFTSYQIMRHEAGHDMIAKGEVDLNEVRTRIDKTFTSGEVRSLCTAYADAYAGTEMTAQEIWEEVVCDSLGDMNIFADSKISDAAAFLLAHIKVESETVAQENSRAPPSETGPVREKFSKEDGTGILPLDDIQINEKKKQMTWEEADELINQQKGLSYRFYGRDDPMSRAGYAMFSDDYSLNSKAYGGDNARAFSVSENDLTDFHDIKGKIIEARHNTDENLPWVLEDYTELGDNEFADMFNPEDIVNSADAWDNEDLVQWFWENVGEPNEIPGVKTQDGAIAFDLGIIRRNLPAEIVFTQSPKVNSVEDAQFSREIPEANYEALKEKYGYIPAGERAYREVQVPKKTADDKYVSRTIRTVLEAKATPDAMVPTLERMVAKGDFSYDRYTDKQAISDAESRIKTEGWQKTLNKWKNSTKEGISKENTAIGWALYNNAANSGDVETAIDVLDTIVKRQRNAAQALQATRLLKQQDPSTQLYAAQRSVENLTEDLKKQYGEKAPDLKIDRDLAEKFLNAKDDDARTEAMKEIYRDIGRQMPSRFIDKWNAWRYFSMLGNPRTHVRNIVGNVGFVPAVTVKNVIGAGIESAANAVSGGKVGRTKAILTTKDAGLIKAAWSDYANIREQALGSGKYNDNVNVRQEIEEGRTIFKPKLLEAMRKFNSTALDAEDAWFSKPHYAAALAQFCKANGITAEQVSGGKGIEAAREYAIREAQKATYRDTNAFSQMISDLGRYRGDNKMKRLGSTLAEGILPFRKTPANILVRGVEYSPIGFLKSISYDLVQVQKGNMQATEMIDRAAAGLTGTGLMMLGLYMAKEGILRGSGGDDEKKKKFDELQGHQEYAMELPNGTSITLDWLAPEALPFFVGANLYEQMQANNGYLTMSDMLQAASNVTDPLLSMSCLQSLNDVFDAVGYASSGDTNALTSAVASAATSYLTQGIPTVFGQAERTGESTRMTTYTDKNKFLTPDMQYALGKASARIPGVDYGQIPFIDAWGRTENSGGVVARAFNNFANPAYTSKISDSKMEDELSRLYEATGETKVLPQRAPKSFTVNKENKQLTGEEYVKYATKRGQTSYKIVSELTGLASYKSMSDGDKADAVAKAYEYANIVGKMSVSNYQTDGWAAKVIDTVKKTGVSEAQYIALYLAKGGIESLKDKNGDTISNSEGLQIMELVYQQKGLSDKQRAALFEDFGVGKSIRHWNRARVDEQLAIARKKAG